MFAKVEGGVITRYPYSIESLQADTGFIVPTPPDPAVLAHFGVVTVMDAPVPEFNINTHEIKATVELADGVAVRKWIVSPLPAEVVSEYIQRRKDEAWEGIKRERDRRQQGGVQVAGKWFHTDPSSRIQQISLTMVGANLPPSLQWKTMDGTFVTMTPQLAAQIFSASIANDQAIFARAEEHRTAMEKAKNPNNYDYLTGWPPIFEDK